MRKGVGSIENAR